MSRPPSLSTAGKANVAGLVVGAAGIAILFASIDFPVPVPVGTILLLLVAALVGLGRWRWTPIVGVLMPLSIFIGGFVSPGLFDRLTQPGEAGAFVGTWVQMPALLVAIVAGLVATWESYRAPTREERGAASGAPPA